MTPHRAMRLGTHTSTPVIAIAILCMAMAEATFAQVSHTRQTYELKGPVKSVRTETSKSIEATDQAKPNNFEITSEVCFDEKGRAISQSEYSYNPMFKMKGAAFINSFDTQGKLRLIKVSEPGGVHYANIAIGYSENDRKVVQDYTTLEGVVYHRFAYLLNERGKTIELCDGQPDKLPRSCQFYVYDDKDRLLEWTSFNREKQLQNRHIISYDDQSHTSTDCYYDARRKLMLKIVNRLDEQGRDIERTTFNGEGKLVRKVHLSYKLDQFGNWIEVAILSDPMDTLTTPSFERRVITYYK